MLHFETAGAKQVRVTATPDEGEATDLDPVDLAEEGTGSQVVDPGDKLTRYTAIALNGEAKSETAGPVTVHFHGADESVSPLAKVSGPASAELVILTADDQAGHAADKLRIGAGNGVHLKWAVANAKNARLTAKSLVEKVCPATEAAESELDFDHLLGWISLPSYGNRLEIEGLKGGIDPANQELAEPTYRNRGRNQTWRPYIADKDIWLASDLPHGRHGVQTQMSSDFKTGEKRERFAMDGFPQALYAEHPDLPPRNMRPQSMMMMPPDLIPATSFLAREFMVCDHWFSAIPTDTHPNRLMSLAGYTKIDETSGKPPDHRGTVVDWCEERNVRWRIYSDSFSFVQLFTGFDYHGWELTDRKHFRDRGKLAHDFQKESAGTFPQLVIVEPQYADDPVVDKLNLSKANDNHPPSPMGPGEAFLAEVIRQ